MRRFAIRPYVILPILGCSAITAAEAEDHLAPCVDFSQEYERRVEAIAEKATPGTMELWVTVIPAFTPEWSVIVSADSGRQLLTHVVFDRSLWHSSWIETSPGNVINDPSKGDARATARTVAISEELYRALRSEWDRSIETARPARELVMDGVMFNFRLPGQCARAHSPRPETRGGKLVTLVGALARYADREIDSASAQSETGLLEQLDEVVSHPIN